MRARLEAENRELQERLDLTIASTADMENLVGDLRNRLAQSETSGQEAGQELARAKEGMAGLVSEVESLKEAQELIERDREALKARMEEIEKKGEEQIAALQEERDMLRRQLEEVHHDLTRERTQSEGLESDEIASLRIALRDVTEERDVVRQQRDVQLNSLAVELSALKSELIGMRDERDALVRQVASFDSMVQKEIATVLQAVEAERDGLKKQLEDMSEMSDYVTSLKDTIRAVEAEREVLQKQVHDLKEKSATLAPAADGHAPGEEEDVTLPQRQVDISQLKAKAALRPLDSLSSTGSDGAGTPTHKADDGSRSSSRTSSPGLLTTTTSSAKKGSEWMEEREVNPLPPFGLSSPVIEYLLHQW